MRNPPPALRKFLAAYDPKIGRLFYAARRTILAAAPNATELIYDAYNAVSAVYAFTDRLKDAFCHVAAYRSHVNLGFNRGGQLADPQGLLAGSGTSIRHIRIAAVADLQRPGVQRLVAAAVKQAPRPDGPPPARPRAVVKPVYPKKRRPSAAS